MPFLQHKTPGYHDASTQTDCDKSASSCAKDDSEVIYCVMLTYYTLEFAARVAHKKICTEDINTERSEDITWKLFTCQLCQEYSGSKDERCLCNVKGIC